MNTFRHLVTATCVLISCSQVLAEPLVFEKDEQLQAATGSPASERPSVEEIKIVLSFLEKFDPSLGSPRFTNSQVKEPREFWARVKSQNDPVSQYIYAHSWKVFRMALDSPSTDDSAFLSNLVNVLNSMLDDSELYSEERFPSSRLPDRAADLLAKRPYIIQDDLYVLNRLLLTEAYPSHLVSNNQDMVVLSLRRVVHAWAQRYEAISNEDKHLIEARMPKEAEVEVARLVANMDRYTWERERLKQVKTHVFWTNVIGYVIAVIAHGLLAVGIGAAITEFRNAERMRNEARQMKYTQKTLTIEETTGEAEAKREIETEGTEVKLSLEGIAVKTSLNGLVLLLVALAFYFLYLKFVFPITVVPT